MKYCFCLLLVLISASAFGQKEALLTELADKACACITDAEEGLDMEMVVGICLIQSTGSKTDEIEEVLGLSLTDMDNYEALLEQVIPYMEDCPALQALVEAEEATGTDDEEPGWDDLFSEEGESEAEWSDIDAAQQDGAPEYGGPENKTFITTAIPNTNGSGLTRPSVIGKITAVETGLINTITLQDDKGASHVLYQVSPAAGADQLRKGAKLTVYYRTANRYFAAKGQMETVWLITGVE